MPSSINRCTTDQRTEFALSLQDGLRKELHSSIAFCCCKRSNPCLARDIAEQELATNVRNGGRPWRILLKKAGLNAMFLCFLLLAILLWVVYYYAPLTGLINLQYIILILKCKLTNRIRQTRQFCLMWLCFAEIARPFLLRPGNEAKGKKLE